MVVLNWDRPVLFLDLEDPEHFASLSQPMLFLERYADHTVVLDEVQRLPALFPVLRVLIDRDRRPGRFILLGSAAPEFVRQASESLAGRVAYLELPPLTLAEVSGVVDYQTHWLRGGFPGSLLAPDDAFSLEWRKNFVRTYLERDLPGIGIHSNPVQVGQFWTMLAHMSGNLSNTEKLAASLSLHAQTVRKYLHLFESAFLLRTVFPFIPNVPKRLVKSPKLYLRDTGILHYLLAISNWQSLLGNPALGSSWETYVVNEIAACMPADYQLYFYRTHAGAEADLVLAKGNVPQVLVEIKFSTSPVLGKGFHVSRQDLRTSRHFVVAPVKTPFPLQGEVEVVGLAQLSRLFEV
ncbi:MAG: hypothetical protein RI973_590 [Bacteroidota bacterium]|jgi:predicted AAA+ superfamily ATPase